MLEITTDIHMAVAAGSCNPVHSQALRALFLWVGLSCVAKRAAEEARIQQEENLKRKKIEEEKKAKQALEDKVCERWRSHCCHPEV